MLRALGRVPRWLCGYAQVRCLCFRLHALVSADRPNSWVVLSARLIVQPLVLHGDDLSYGDAGVHGDAGDAGGTCVWVYAIATATSCQVRLSHGWRRICGSRCLDEESQGEGKDGSAAARPCHCDRQTDLKTAEADVARLQVARRHCAGVTAANQFGETFEDEDDSNTACTVEEDYMKRVLRSIDAGLKYGLTLDSSEC